MTISALSDDQTKTELKVEKFEEAYQTATTRGKRVRALTLVNPQVTFQRAVLNSSFRLESGRMLLLSRRD